MKIVIDILMVQVTINFVWKREKALAISQCLENLKNNLSLSVNTYVLCKFLMLVKI